MIKATDFRLDETEDLEIKNGDFVISDSDQTHIIHILKANKGYFFENPLIGVGIINELNSSTNKQALKQNIRRQLVLDNYSVKEIKISPEGKININAIRRK